MPTRRQILKLIGTTAATCTLLDCSSPEGASPATGPVAAGNLSAVPVGTLQFVTGQPVVLGRDEDGLYALSAICTHQQCDMSHDGSINSTTIVCNCHGSSFSSDGAVLNGPAHAPLPQYAVELAANGNITVHAETIVAMGTRTVVPS